MASYLEQGRKKVLADLGALDLSYSIHATGTHVYKNGDRAISVQFSQPTQAKPSPAVVVTAVFIVNQQLSTWTCRIEEERVQLIHAPPERTVSRVDLESAIARARGARSVVQSSLGLAMRTVFEAPRVREPRPVAEDTTDKSSDDEQASAPGAFNLLINAKQQKDEPKQEAKHCNQDHPEIDLPTLISRVLTAADEWGENKLPHKEVAMLLASAGLGLASWDLKTLLSGFPEDDEGFVDYRPLAQAAPELIASLAQRREKFNAALAARHAPAIEVEHVVALFQAELEESAKALIDKLGAEHRQFVARRLLRSAAEECSTRFSPQEVTLLMQSVPTDDNGQADVRTLLPVLVKLRSDCLRNAVIESDLFALRTHLVLVLRKQSLTKDLKLQIWHLRNVLLSCDQLVISRLQIHVLLSLLDVNEQGWVDLSHFLKMCCLIIPYCSQPEHVTRLAQSVAKEKAAKQARDELDEGMPDTQADAPRERSAAIATGGELLDKDSVEKAFILLGVGLCDRVTGTMDISALMNLVQSEQTRSATQLTERELRGFVAESVLGQSGDVAFNEMIKTWVPVIHEIRQSPWYENLVSVEWDKASENAAALAKVEAQVPILREEAQTNSRMVQGSVALRSRSGMRSQNLGSVSRSIAMSSLRSKGANALVASAALSGFGKNKRLSVDGAVGNPSRNPSNSLAPQREASSAQRAGGGLRAPQSVV